MSQHRKSLECPFTWELDENLARNLDEANELDIDVGEEPVLALVNSIMLTYCRAIKGEYNAAMIKKQETEEIWNKLNLSQIQDEGISTKVLEHVKQATAYHVLCLYGDSYEADLIMDVLTDFCQSLNSSLDESTLEGCKSIAWMSFHEAGIEFALDHVEKAAPSSPNCALWHFLRAKSLRHTRKYVEFSRDPSDEERRAFLRCRELSDRPFYAIYVAQMYWESRDNLIFKQMNRDIYEDCLNKSEVISVGMLLPLVLAFMRSHDYTRANACLERVQKINPKNPTFLYYKGRLFMKTENFKVAKVYLEEAAKIKNFGADMDLIFCNQRLDAKFDCLGLLQKMLGKYENIHWNMESLLHIAMQYYNRKDYVNSAQYFKQAMDLNIENQQFTEFKNRTFNKANFYNLFNFVCDELLPKLQRLSLKSSVDLQEIINYLKTQCSNANPKTKILIQKTKKDENIDKIERLVCNYLSKEKTIQIRKIIKKQDDELIIICRNDESVNKAIEILNDKLTEMCKIHKEQFVNPTVKVIDINNFEYMDIKALEEDINVRNFSNFDKKCQILRSHKNEKNKLLTVILDVPSVIHMHIRENEGRIVVGEQNYNVFDLIQKADPCLNCGKFGHSTNKCKNISVCLICAGKHKTINCSGDSENKCVNCSFSNEKYNTDYDTKHIATDSYLCKILKTKIRESIDATDYIIKPIVSRYRGYNSVIKECNKARYYSYL